MIPLVADLGAAVGDEATAWVHRGATSQDILDTALMLVARRARAHILADLDATAASLARLATEDRATPLPGRTLTQHAVPTTFGLKAAGWRHLVLDARDRLASLALPAQLGGAAGTLAALGGRTELLAAYAAETGLDEPLLPWHVLRTPSPSWARRSPWSAVPSARSRQTCWCSPAPRSARWPRAREAPPAPCCTRPTRSGPR